MKLDDGLPDAGAGIAVSSFGGWLIFWDFLWDSLVRLGGII